jgi:glutathione S-transferase
VPTLVLGRDAAAQSLTESLIIADYAARNAVDVTDLWFADEMESRIGGLCFGIIDAAAAIMAGRMVTSGSLGDPAFDTSPVAGRRQVAIQRSLDSLEDLLAGAETPPAARPCLAAFLAVVVIDYLKMRFGDLYESPARPHLAQMVEMVSARPAVQRTRPLFTQFTPLDA